MPHQLLLLYAKGYNKNMVRLSVDQQQLAAILQKHGVTEVAVFGSFSRGDVGPESDLDLLVNYRPGTTLFDIANLQGELQRLLGRKVDLVSRKYLSPRLAKRIQKDVRPIAAVL